MNRKFNNEVQHLGEQKGKCYLKCLWEKDIIIWAWKKESITFRVFKKGVAFV